MIFFGSIEAGFRLFTAFPPSTRQTYRQDAQYMYFHAPGSLGWEISPFGEFSSVKLEYNIHGFRGGDFPREKPEDEIRVALLGDSFVEARQVKEDESVAGVLQTLLRSKGLNVRTINASCSAYTTTTEYLLLKYYLLDFDPDILVLFFSPNDYCDNYWYGNYSAHPSVFKEGLPDSLMPQAYSPLRSSSTGFTNWIKQKSATFAYFSRIADLTKLQEKRLQVWKKVAESPEFYNSPRQINRINLDADELHVLNFTHQGIIEIARICQARGIEMILVIIPFAVQVNAEEWSLGKITYGYNSLDISEEDLYQRRIKKVAESLDVEVVDLLPAFRQASSLNKRVFFPYDGHLSQHGHAVAATEIVPVISDILNLE